MSVTWSTDGQTNFEKFRIFAGGRCVKWTNDRLALVWCKFHPDMRKKRFFYFLFPVTLAFDLITQEMLLPLQLFVSSVVFTKFEVSKAFRFGVNRIGTGRTNWRTDRQTKRAKRSLITRHQRLRHSEWVGETWRSCCNCGRGSRCCVRGKRRA